MSGCVVALETSSAHESRPPPISAWLHLANFGILAAISLLTFKLYITSRRIYRWITTPPPNYDDIRVILVLGPKTDLNQSILRKLSEKFETPITVYNGNERDELVKCSRRYLLYCGDWSPKCQEDVVDLSSSIRASYGCVDILVVSEATPDGSLGSTNFLTQINQQLLKQFWIAMTFLPGMLERDRGIVLSVAMERTSTLANAGVMRTLFEDILQKDTTVTLALVEKNTFLERLFPSLPTDLMASLIVDGLGHHSILVLPSFTNYIIHLPAVFVRSYFGPLVDFLKKVQCLLRKKPIKERNPAS